MQQTFRNLAVALIVGATVALLVDVTLLNALAALQSPRRSSSSPWWLIGQVMQRSTWIAAAAILWFSAPVIAEWFDSRISTEKLVVGRSAAFVFVARAMIVLPLLWLCATWLVWAVKMTLVGSWGSEGRIFIAGYYYSNVILGYVPWGVGAFALLALSRQVANE